MKRYLILPLVLACVTLLAWADAPSSTESDEARVLNLRRNKDLLEKLVESGITLSEEDALKRLDSCNDLAKEFAKEVHQSAKDNESARTQEMTKHLNQWLKDGVATNLKAARSLSIPESAWKIEIQKRAENTLQTMKDLENDLNKLSQPGSSDLKNAITTLNEGLAEVEKMIDLKKQPGGK